MPEDRDGLPDERTLRAGLLAADVTVWTMKIVHALIIITFHGMFLL